jgi:hypothetical protein
MVELLLSLKMQEGEAKTGIPSGLGSLCMNGLPAGQPGALVPVKAGESRIVATSSKVPMGRGGFNMTLDVPAPMNQCLLEPVTAIPLVYGLQGGPANTTPR